MNMSLLEKKCRKCEIIKDIKEFSICRTYKDGYQNKCKGCDKKYREENKDKIKKYREENKDYFKKKKREWVEENKDRIKEYTLVYYDENRDKLKEHSKVYYDENRDKLKEYSKIYREENKDYFKKKNLEWREENKDRMKEYNEENKDRKKEWSKIYREENKDRMKEYSREYSRNRILNDPLYRLRTRVRTLIWTSLKDGGYTKGSKSNDILGCSYEELLDHLNDNKYGFIYGDDNLDIDHIIPLSRATSEEEIIELNHYSNLQLLPSEYNRYIKIDKDFDNECLEEWLYKK